jgi:beta-phosphoglucomutase
VLCFKVRLYSKTHLVQYTVSSISYVMKNKGVLFDYNGVLVNDEHIHEQAMAQVVQPFGVHLTHSLYETHCLGRTDKTAFESLQHLFLSKLSHTHVDRLVKDKTEIYLQLIKEASILYPGIQEIFATFRKYYKLAVVTAALREEVIPVLKRWELLPLLEEVITANEVTQGKPHPEGYIKGKDALQLPSTHVVVIEDTPSGIQAAKAAGLPCIAVLHTMPANKLSEADMIIEDITKLNEECINHVLHFSPAGGAESRR